MSVKKLHFNEDVRTRSIEPKEAPFKPLVGDTVYAKWILDDVIYRARILEHLDSGNYILDFIGYGKGVSEQGEIYDNIFDIPVGTRIEEGVEEDFEEAFKLRRKKEAAAKKRRRKKDRQNKEEESRTHPCLSTASGNSAGEGRL